MKKSFYIKSNLNGGIRKFVYIALFLLCNISVNAQTPPYFKGTGTGGNTIPMNTAGSHCQQIYTPSDFNTVPISGLITKIYFRNSVANATGTYTNFEVSFLQNGLTAFPSTTFLTGFTNALTSPSQVINGNATAGGWYEIPLAIPFLYDNSQTLILEIKYTSRTGGMSNPTSSASGNKRLSIITAPGPATGNLSPIWGDFGMEVIPAGVCTNPPTPGVSTANPTSGLCLGGNIALNLTGNSSGSGQTYQWQSSSNIGGPYSNIGGSLISASFNTAATSTSYYRCEVTCSGNSQISPPVLVNVNPPFPAGTYTINSALVTSGSNYQTFTDAVSALSCGIAGPIVFNVVAASGPYTEQVIIPQIINASSTNTITFNGNGNNLTFGATLSTAPATLELNGADYFKFNNLNVTGTGATYALTVHLWNGADDNAFTNCSISASTTSTSTTTQSAFSISGTAASATGTGNGGSNNTVTGCTLIGGNYTVALAGQVSNTNNQFINNNISEFYGYGVYQSYSNNTLVKNNLIERPTRSIVTTTYGIYFTTSTTNFLADGNTIRNLFGGITTSSSAGYGLYANVSGTAGNENMFYNNLVYNINNGAGTQGGIYIPSVNYVKAYHNTISLDHAGSTSGTTYGIYCNGTGVDIKNNISFITRGGSGTKYCIYNSAATATSNNNVFFINSPAGTNYIGYQSSAYTTLAAYQTATGKDLQSVNQNPNFTNVGSGNFTPTNNLIENIGTNVGVANDILGTVRTLASPDPGAYEFGVPPALCSSAPSNGGTAISSSSTICTGSSVTVSATGYTIDNGVSYQWTQSSSLGGPYTPVSGATDPDGFTSGSLTANTFYRLEVTCVNVNLTTNSNVVSVSVINPGINNTTPNSRCGTGTVNLGVSVNSGATANWYAAASGGSPLFTGTPFTTPAISSTTNYWVAASSGGSTYNTSKLAPESASTGTVLTTYGQDFTVTNGFTLNSVQVFSTTGTSITVALYNSNGTTQLMTTGPVAVTTGTSPTINLGWTIAPGTYRLCVPGMTGNFIRDNTGVTYPFALTGIGTMNGFVSAITGSVTTTSSYYFVYNWSVSTGCESARQMVTATVNTAPSITASTTQSLVCNGGLTTLNVNSSNDPNYTYTWTSTPSGFNTNGASVNANPVVNTTYTVTAIDNTAGAFSGCTAISTIDVTAQPASATVTGSPESICASSGSSILGLIPASGYPVGSIQWQSSPTGSGYTDIGGATINTYPTGTISSSTFYRALIKNGNGTVCISPFKEIVVGVPTLNSTTDGTRCGTGTAILQATGSAGSSVYWFDVSTGGTSIGTGNSFTTPVINNSTTFYAEASSGVSPVNVTVGTQTSTTQAGMPFRAGNATAFRTQYLYTAAELTSSGLVAGTWDEFKWTITTAVGAGTGLGNFTIRVGHTGVSVLTSAMQPSPSTTVFGPVNYVVTSALGDLPFTFSTPFTWNGTSNVIIEICHDNPAPSGVSGQVAAHNPGFVCVSAVANVCGTSTGGTTQSVRPIIKISGGTGCSSVRVPVIATVTPAPAIFISTNTSTICPGGTASLSVTSPNDPDYTYTWTSNPAGFTATGAGPHVVSPSITTKYYVNALDGSGGANQNCAMIDSVTILNGGPLVAGTVSTFQNEICVSGSTTLSMTGASGGANQWQVSTLGVGGPWTNVGTGSSTYNSGTITQTTYYRVLTSCNTTSVSSNVVTVTVNNPQLLSTSPGTRCGFGSVALGAATNPGNTINWYTSPSGGTAIGTGTTFNTPNINSTTNYYAAASSGSGGTAFVGMVAPIGGSSGVGANTYGLRFDAFVPFTLKTLTLFPNSGTNGTPGTVTIGILDSISGAVLQQMTVSVTGYIQSSNPTPVTVNMNMNINAGIGLRMVLMSYTGVSGLIFQSSPCSNCTWPYIIPGVVSIKYGTYTNSFHPELYYYFYNWQVSTGCESPRQLVTATVTPSDPISVTSTFPAVCTGGSTSLFVSSNIDPDYSYSWTSTPSGFTQTGHGPFTVTPSVTTTYYVLATNTSGGANQGCTHLDSVTVVAGGTLASGTMSVNLDNHCVSGNSLLTLTGTSGGLIQWQRSFVSVTGPWTTVQTNGITHNTGALNQTAYYQAVVSCETSSLTTNVETITVNNPQLTSTSGDTRCGPGVVDLIATPAGGSVNWYANSSGGSPISTGNNYSPSVTGTTTYYAAASFGGGLSSLGLPNRVGGTTNSGYSDVGLMFTATQAFTLQSVAVYPVATTPTGNATFTIALKNSSGTILQSTTVSYPTSVAPGVKTLVPLNFNVPAGTNHRLVFTSASGGGITGFIRESSVGYTYPYTLSGIASITSAYTSGASASYYYYFYDWQVVTGCEGTRVPVVATVNPSPAITVSTTANAVCSGQTATLSVTSSNPNYTYTWNPGGLNGSSVSVSPTTPTTYILSAIDISGGSFNQCTAIDSIVVNGSPGLAPTASASSNSPVCEGQSISFFGNNTTSGQTSGNGYSWSGPNGFNDIVQNPTLSNASAAASGTYTVTVTNQFGCSETTTTQVTVAPLPALNILSQTNVSCNGGSDGAFTIEVTNGSGFYLYDQNGNINFDGNFTGFSAGTYIVQVTDGNSCASSIPVTITEPDPTTTADAGVDQSACSGSTVTLAGNTAVVGTGSWSLISGSGTFTNDTDPATTVTGIGFGLNTYRWTIDNALCFNSNFDDVTVTGTDLPTAIISGTQEICIGGTANLSISFTGTAPWSYSVNGGAPVSTSTSPEIVSVTPGTTTVYTITSLSDASCTGSGTGSATVTVTQAPPASSSNITSLPADACVGSTVVVSTNVVLGATSYTWSAPAGTLINGLPSPQTVSTNTVSLTLGALPANSSSWLICVFASNACGNTNTNCKYIRGSLSTPGAISGSTVSCPNTGPSTYTTTAVTGASSYLWSITGDASVTGTGLTGSVTFGPTFTTGSLCVRALLPCGYQGPTRCMSIANGTPLLGAMIGTFAVCPGSNGVAYSVPPSAGATTYNWTVPAGATIASGAGTNSITINFGPTYTNGNVCVIATSVCGINSLPRCKTVGSDKPGTPGNFTTGAVTGVCGQTITYNVNSVSGATGYTWTAPAGATIASANGTNTIDISFSNSFTTGNVCVTADNGCGSGTPRCVLVKATPSNPGVITGTNSVCAFDAGISYSVSPVFGATGYVWTIPSGAAIVSGQGTTSIIVDYGTSGGVIGVTATGTCGNSGTRTLAVAMNCKLSSSVIPDASINAYPNPVSSNLTVELKTNNSGTYTVELLDLSGRIVKSEVMNAVTGLNRNSMDVSTLAKGMYMLNVKNENGFAQQLRIAVE